MSYINSNPNPIPFNLQGKGEGQDVKLWEQENYQQVKEGESNDLRVTIKFIKAVACLNAAPDVLFMSSSNLVVSLHPSKIEMAKSSQCQMSCISFAIDTCAHVGSRTTF